MNSLVSIHGKSPKIFHKNKTGKWMGLTPMGKLICRLLCRLSPWMTPDMLFVVAEKNNDSLQS